MKPVVLIGRADCWKDDFERFKSICNDFDVMAIGLNCLYDGKIKYFVTYHSVDIQQYKNNRPGDYLVICHEEGKYDNVDIVVEMNDKKKLKKGFSGSSALLAVIAAIRLEYKKVILCGCPMEGPHKKEGRKDFPPYSHFQKGWAIRKEEIEGYAKSMSGWTKDFLGEPTIEWLNK